MNAAEKLAPLAALRSSPPAYVHEVRLDEGADGDVWAYILAHPDPKFREKQRFVCVVARSDKVLAGELAALEAELAAWVEAAMADARDFVQRGLAQVVERRDATSNTLLQEAELAGAQAARAVEHEAMVKELRETIEPLRAETKPEVRAQVALLDLELRRLVAARDAMRLDAETHRDRVLELDRDLAAAKMAVAQAEADFEADVAARFAKRTPPPALTDRIAELQDELGHVTAHASDEAGVRIVPSAVVGFVEARAEWMRGSGSLPR